MSRGVGGLKQTTRPHREPASEPPHNAGKLQPQQCLLRVGHLHVFRVAVLVAGRTADDRVLARRAPIEVAGVAPRTVVARDPRVHEHLQPHNKIEMI